MDTGLGLADGVMIADFADEKDDKGLCHKLGSYCSDKVLGICVTSKDAYCCFASKLTRILQEQGRPQLGKPWGSAKKGTCEGFTIDEFSRLNLSVMDFSEVVAEFTDAAYRSGRAWVESLRSR